jgi:GrpB-like predicted nucleotidyltransferase (UPF0157 family)
VLPIIIDYRTSWPQEFHDIAEQLRRGLGELALRIDHIGSTSVPDLAAKDIIDIQLTVAALDGGIIDALERLGYRLRPEYDDDHLPPGSVEDAAEWSKLYFSPPEGQRRSHLHVRVAGRANQRYPILFRDYLRSHPQTAAAYAELKRRLAAELADGKTYPEVKDPAVDLIYFAAEEWAAASGWHMGPSDA